LREGEQRRQPHIEGLVQPPARPEFRIIAAGDHRQRGLERIARILGIGEGVRGEEPAARGGLRITAGIGNGRVVSGTDPRKRCEHPIDLLLLGAGAAMRTTSASISASLVRGASVSDMAADAPAIR